MEIFLLGAGRPARGDRPSALKQIARHSKAMDWQLHSFEVIDDAVQLTYLGGYQINEVVQAYPQLNFTVIPDWESRSVLHTLLQAPFTGEAILISYSDTVFRQQVIKALMQHSADVVFGIDTQWQQRYQSRSQQDIHCAETLRIEQFDKKQQGLVEFTGLVYFKPKTVEYLSRLEESSVGKNLMDLLVHLQSEGFELATQEVAGHWAEFNEPGDIAHFILGSKADTLARLQPLVRQSHIGNQVSFTIADWRQNSVAIVETIKSVFFSMPIVVRSSAKGEDNWLSSNAGGFESLLNVKGYDTDEIESAVNRVIESYGAGSSCDDQVLVQAFLQDVRCAGVVFTCGLETGSPYYRFNFDDKSHSTESVTAGTGAELRTIVVNRLQADSLGRVEARLLPVLRAVQELEELLGYDKLDIEFALDNRGRVHIFQVRPVTVDHSAYEFNESLFRCSLEENMAHFVSQQVPLPFVHGDRTAYGNMPDWNPAEIIGTHPKPLAFSLYRLLITNEVWAQQRAEFGYRDVRPHPLIVAFSGQPYVDVRASFNSFIPASLSDRLAADLADAYITMLEDHPQRHDKVEFEVALTIWTPNFAQQASRRLLPYGLSQKQINELESALRQITCQALLRLEDDIAPVQKLVARREQIESSSLNAINRCFELLDDCRRYGTLAFSHAARAGFVATTLLKSFVDIRIFSESRVADLMATVNTVAAEFEEDKKLCAQGKLDPDLLIARYGHLRQGTYEITAQAYWEDPESFLANEKNQKSHVRSTFKLSEKELRNIQQVLCDMGSELKPIELIEYFRKAIQAREKVKFIFTQSLSKALDCCVELGEQLSISREDTAFLEYQDLEQYRLNALGAEILRSRIEQRKKYYLVTELVELPTLISREIDFYCFERQAALPNFITREKILAPVRVLDNIKQSLLSGNIILIPQADPGYDWLFSHSIGGLITKYGGANSHMAIRAAEIGLPAAIGVGETLYETVSKMRKLELDCANQIIREVS